MSVIVIHRDVKSVTSSLVELNKDYNVLENKILNLTSNRFVLSKKYNDVISLLDIFQSIVFFYLSITFILIFNKHQ